MKIGFNLNWPLFSLFLAAETPFWFLKLDSAPLLRLLRAEFAYIYFVLDANSVFFIVINIIVVVNKKSK